MNFNSFMGVHEGRSVSAPRTGLQCDTRASVPLRTGSLFVMPPESSGPGEQTMQFMPMRIVQWVRSIAVLSLLLSTAGVPLLAASNGGHPVHLSALDLVKVVVRNEKEAREHPGNYYKFVQEETTPKGTKTSIRIETPDGEIGKAISVNGKPPSQTQCQKETVSLKKLATDSELQNRQSEDQKEENERIDKLMVAIPQAFIFHYKGKQQGNKLRTITFRPNPHFDPQSRETELLKGMQGTLWVDPASHRLVKIEGTLIQGVDFGWGFLASIHRGGRFVSEQSKVAGGNWKQTFLQVDLDGSKLVFGQIHVHFKDQSHSFVPLANPPSLSEAVNMLDHGATACREGKDRSTTAQAQMN